MIGLWRWRGTSRRGGGAGTADPTPPETEAIELLTTEGRVSGQIVASERRVSDLLNESGEIAVWVPEHGGWVTVPTDSILLAVPPERPGERQLQVHRRLRKVLMQVGALEVEGLAHVTPGVSVDAYFGRAQRQFVPLTDVMVEGPGPDDVEGPIPVAIVNLHAVATLQAP